MKLRISRIAPLLVLAFLKSAYGQGCTGNWMNANYNTYATLSTDGTKIYSSVLVSGAANGTCPLSCYCNGTTHTPHAYNKIGSTGGWGQGSAVPWNSYISYQNNQSTPASSILVSTQTQGEIICSGIGVFYLTALNSVFTATNPLCGGKSAYVAIHAPPVTATCNSSTTNTAAVSVSGTGAPSIQSISVDTSTDNYLLLDLIGGPYNFNTLCTDKLGSSQWCYSQDFKGATPNQYTGKTGNIDWSWNIYCSSSSSPDIYGTAPQAVTCQ